MSEHPLLLAGCGSRVASLAAPPRSPLVLGGLASIDLPLSVRFEALPASRFPPLGSTEASLRSASQVASRDCSLCSRVVAPDVAPPAHFFSRSLSLRSFGLAVSGNQRFPGVSGSEIRDLRKSFALPGMTKDGSRSHRSNHARVSSLPMSLLPLASSRGLLRCARSAPFEVPPDAGRPAGARSTKHGADGQEKLFRSGTVPEVVCSCSPAAACWKRPDGSPATAGSLLFVLMLVALGGYAYRRLRGDDVEWPDEESGGEGGTTSDGTDDEWDYNG